MIHSIKNDIPVLIIIGKIGQFIYNKIIIYFSRKFIHMYIRATVIILNYLITTSQKVIVLKLDFLRSLL